MSQRPGETIERVVLEDEWGPVCFYLLPFVKPSMVRSIVGAAEDGGSLSYDETLRRLIKREEIDTGIRNVLVSHQFYLPVGQTPDQVERMASEVRAVGDIDEVRADVLEPFDYAALGHIHKPTRVGGERWRYCGTPLACSVSEAGQEKSVVQVELGYKGSVRAELLPLRPLRGVRVVRGTLEEVLTERGRVMAENTRIDSLYRRLSGNVTGARMDVETFVQRYYLKRILAAANARFREMTAGQYELRAVSEDMAGAGGNHGLDLMVYSAVTGREREARTLSGGESFMAALSLALGMAGQIQQSAAAINLDIMFIDEGFGSLDDHARGQAVRVLKQMAGGSRLIGIISHVTELKQELDDQLIVSKDESGSHTRWQLS